MLACLLSLFVMAPAQAQTPGEIIGEAARAVGYQPSIPPAADFVEQARPDIERLDYQPLAPADRANHRKSAKDLDKIAHSLEGAKSNSRSRAARVGATDQPAGRASKTPVQ